MVTCSRCEKDPRRVCNIPPNSDRCTECSLAGNHTKCDVWGPTTEEWRIFERAENKVEEEYTAAVNEQTGLLERHAAVAAKVLRLSRQKEMLRIRGKEMLDRGLAALDEMDEAAAAPRSDSQGADAATSDPSDLLEDRFPRREATVSELSNTSQEPVPKRACIRSSPPPINSTLSYPQ